MNAESCGYVSHQSDYTVRHYFSHQSNCLIKESPSSDICTSGAGLPFCVTAIMPNTTLPQHSLKLLIQYFSTFIVSRRCRFGLLGPPHLPMIILNYSWLAETFWENEGQLENVLLCHPGYQLALACQGHLLLAFTSFCPCSIR